MNHIARWATERMTAKNDKRTVAAADVDIETITHSTHTDSESIEAKTDNETVVQSAVSRDPRDIPLQKLQ